MLNPFLPSHIRQYEKTPDLRHFFFLKILACFLFSTLKTVGVFAQNNNHAQDAEKLWLQIEARLGQTFADTSFQTIVELVRGQCGRDNDCLDQTYFAVMYRFEQQFNLPAAIFIGEELRKTANMHGNTRSEIIVLRDLSRYYNAVGVNRLTFVNIERAIKLAEVLGDRPLLMRAKLSKLHFSADGRNVDEVLAEYEALLAEAVASKDSINIRKLQINIIDFARGKGRFEKAIEHIAAFEKRQRESPATDSGRQIAPTIALARAEHAVFNKRPDDAERFFQQSLSLFESEPDHWRAIEVRLKAADFEWGRGRVGQAKAHLEKAFLKADELKLDDLLAKIFKLKSKIAEAEGQFRDAFLFSKKQAFHDEKFKSKGAGFDTQKYYLQLEKDQQDLELRLKRSQLFYSLISVVLVLLLATGFVVGFYKQRKDKNELAVKNELIEKQSERLQNLDTAKTRFFANISHELRTPLTLLLGPIKSLLNDNDLTPKQAKLLKMANKSGGELELLVNEILDLRKLESGKLGLDEKPTVLRSFFGNYFSQFDSLAERKQIAFSHEIGFSDELTALIDREKCRQIVYNLLSNAFKFTQNGGQIAVQLAIEKGRLNLRVADSGPGIHADDLPHVFDRFFQTNRPEKPAEGGTGIGLNLCHEYAQLFGGSISVESAVGAGSVFGVEFPVKLVENEALKNDKEAVLFDPETSDFIPFLVEKKDETTIFDKKPTILLVEDNLGLQDYIGLILSEKYEVVAAENGLVALEKLKTCRPALILSDLMMPVMDGYQLLEKLKSDDATRHIPVVMLTARAEAEDKLKALRLGVDDYLFKPFDEEELLARIENLLKNQTARRAEIFEENEKSEVGARPVFSEEDKSWLEGFELFVRQKMASDILSVPALAQHFLMSESTLLRQLKRLTGLSPLQYLQEMRLDEARQLLENRRFNSIAQVAAKVGFGDAKSFSRSFRQRFGKSPTDFLGG